MTIDLETVVRMAKESGALVESWMTKPPKPSLFYMSPEQLERFAALILEHGRKPVEAWRDMMTAPKDGTMLRLLVDFEENATEDGDGPHPTIGANNFDNDEQDCWQIAGWNWSHDCFTEGEGTPVGWLPLLDGAPQPPAEQSEPEWIDDPHDIEQGMMRNPKWKPAEQGAELSDNVIFACGKAAGRQEVKDAQQSPEFKQWITRAYREPETTNFTIHNMEVAYQAGRESFVAASAAVAGASEAQITLAADRAARGGAA